MSSIAIAIPCLNEAKNLELLLPQVRFAVSYFKIPTRIYILDGGSKDDTVEVAQRLGATVIQQRGKGYGGAIKTALEDIDADYIITHDADCSHPPAVLRYLYEMREQAEIVIASRYVPQGYATMPFTRGILSRVLNTAFRKILDLPLYDLSSGYRLYKRKAVAELDLQMTTYAVLQEVLVKAYCEGYRIKEVPLHYFPRVHGETHARLWRLGCDYARTLRALWLLRNSIASGDYETRAFFSRIPLQRWWQRKRYRIILKYIGNRLRVLDAGCGSSQLLNGVPQAVGLDILMRKLRFMRAPGRSLVNGSALALPFKSESFEVVISSQVIEHLPEDDRIFGELARCLAPGGALILGTVDYGGWQWPLIERAYRIANPTGYAGEHITRYTRQSLFERLARMGLAIEEHRYICGGELIIKARKPGKTPASFAESNVELVGLLACPVDNAAVTQEAGCYVCTECKRKYPVVDGIPVMLGEKADALKAEVGEILKRL